MATGKPPRYCHRRTDSSFWWYDFRIGGVRYRGSTEREDARGAATFVEDLRSKLRQKATEPSAPKGRKEISLQEALAKFESERASREKTLRDQQRYARYLLSLGKRAATPIHEITVEDFIAYRTRREATPTPRGTFTKASTVNREVVHAQRVFNYLARLGYATPTIYWGLEIDRGAETARVRCLTEAEERRLMEALAVEKPDLLPLVQFTIMAALHKAAVIGLTWEHVDLDTRRATVLLKSKRKVPERHVIPLTERMVALLAQLPRVTGVENVFTYEVEKDTRDKAGVLRRKGSRQPFTASGWTKAWLRALRRANIHDFRFHDLRHTGATRLVRATNGRTPAPRPTTSTPTSGSTS